MKTIHTIFLLILFAAGLLLGVQIPNFVDQYEKRIDAHYLEVNENFKGFQEIANRFFNGSIEALIRKHETSGEPVFEAEAEPLRKIFERKIRFEREHLAMQASLFGQVKHVVIEGDQEIIDETYRNYSPNLPLESSAIIWGVSVALVMTILFELLIILFKYIFRIGRRTQQPASLS